MSGGGPSPCASALGLRCGICFSGTVLITIDSSSLCGFTSTPRGNVSPFLAFRRCSRFSCSRTCLRSSLCSAVNSIESSSLGVLHGDTSEEASLGSCPSMSRCAHFRSICASVAEYSSIPAPASPEIEASKLSIIPRSPRMTCPVRSHALPAVSTLSFVCRTPAARRTCSDCIASSSGSTVESPVSPRIDASGRSLMAPRALDMVTSSCRRCPTAPLARDADAGRRINAGLRSERCDASSSMLFAQDRSSSSLRCSCSIIFFPFAEDPFRGSRVTTGEGWTPHSRVGRADLGRGRASTSGAGLRRAATAADEGRITAADDGRTRWATASLPLAITAATSRSNASSSSSAPSALGVMICTRAVWSPCSSSAPTRPSTCNTRRCESVGDGGAEAELAALHAAPGTTEGKVISLKAFISERYKRGDKDALKQFVTFCSQDSVGLTVSRPVLSQWVKEVLYVHEEEGKGEEDRPINNEGLVALATHAVRVMGERSVSLQEQVIDARQQLSKIYQDSVDYRGAIEALKGIPMDAPCVQQLGDVWKANHFVAIAMFHLEFAEHYEAEQWVNKAWPLMRAETHREDPFLTQLFNSCLARIHDGKRRFLDAARKYYELSHTVKRAEQPLTLQSAIICVILADAGPQRSRLIATLCRDERTEEVEREVRVVLEKMFISRILRAAEVAALERHLEEHHLATDADGQTPLQRAVVQHNLLAASKLYYNISFAELGALLSISAERAERVAARMIVEKRLSGSIDQVRSMLVFADDSGVLVQWDQQINSACNAVSKICDSICASHPERYRVSS
eukprot:Hpha_TRINITY_DN15556_c1_g1::TRINITY_DN15556_c1_g1_i1::g.106821::m.106821/K12178/COPS4, CSN4; COP9 signalosome complex subunit 4